MCGSGTAGAWAALCRPAVHIVRVPNGLPKPIRSVCVRFSTHHLPAISGIIRKRTSAIILNLEFADLLFESLKKYYDSNGKIDEGGYRDQGCNTTYFSFGMCDTLMTDPEVVNNPTVRRLGLMTEKDMARGTNAGMANIYARFHQYLANRIAKEYPGMKLYIMAYYNVQYAGTEPRWQLPANTEVNLCLGGLPNKVHNAAQRADMLKIAREWYESLGNRPIQKLWLYSGTNPFVLAVNGEFVGDIPKMFARLFIDEAKRSAHTAYHG